MLIEEFHLLLVYSSVLIEEALEGWISLFEGRMLIQKFIIMRSFVSVRKNLKSLSDLLKLEFSWFSMLFVFVWMPSWSELLISTFNLKERGAFWNSENLVIVFNGRVSRHFFGFVWFNWYNEANGSNIYTKEIILDLSKNYTTKPTSKIQKNQIKITYITQLLSLFLQFFSLFSKKLIKNALRCLDYYIKI